MAPTTLHPAATLEGMELMPGTSSGDWLLARAGGWTQVGGVVGTGFEAYARILHPATARRVDPSDIDEWGIPRTVEEGRWHWEEVAGRAGATMHPLVQWLAMTGGEQDPELPGDWSVQSPEQGLLAPDLLAATCEHLAAATATPQDLVAGLWAGHGHLHGGGVPYRSGPRWLLDLPWRHGRRWSLGRGRPIGRRRQSGRQRSPSGSPAEPGISRALRARARRGPFLDWPERAMLLFSTSARELGDPGWPSEAGWVREIDGSPAMTPQLLWPAGHEWALASEIDGDSTIVAGSAELVAAILADPRLEAFPVGPEDALTEDSDLVNGS